MNRNVKGFTLIELLVVLVILGIISTISVQVYDVILENSNKSKYNYYYKFIKKGVDLYLDAKKSTMNSGECASVDYQVLVNKDYLKEEDVKCSGNIILRKEKNNFKYDDSNLECKISGKIIKQKESVEAVCNQKVKIIFDNNYEVKKNIVSDSNSDNDWQTLGGNHVISESYSLASSKLINLKNCSSVGCGLFKTLDKDIVSGRKYIWKLNIKTSEEKTINAGVATTGMKEVYTVANTWQSVSGEFNATDSDKGGNRFLISNVDNSIYINSLAVYEVLPSSKVTISFNVGDKFGDNLPKATRDGYTFLGWYTEKENGEKITEDSEITSKKSVTYYAHWAPSLQKINFSLNGVEGNIESVDINYGDNYTLRYPSVTKDGYTFDHWEDESTGTNFDIWDSTMIIWNFNKDVNLKAIWKGESYKVSFDAMGGVLIDEDKTVNYGSTYGSLPIPERMGYNFIGWYFGSSKILETTSVKVMEDHTLYAKWLAKNINIYFHTGYDDGGVDGGSIVGNKIINYENLSSTLYGSLPSIQRTGYTLAGWYTKVNCEGNKIENNAPIQIDGDSLDLYACWRS